MITRSRSRVGTSLISPDVRSLVVCKKKAPVSRSLLGSCISTLGKKTKPKGVKKKKTFLEELYKCLTLDATRDILCREEEMEKIREQLTKMKERGAANRFVYVSGCPGSGKTLVVKSLLDKLRKADEVVFFNCMSINNPSEFMWLLANSIHSNFARPGPRRLLKRLSVNNSALDSFRKNLFAKQTKGVRMVLVLDEIDQLLSAAADTLIPLLDLLSNSNLKFDVICISNDLDFTNRIIPKIHSKYNVSVNWVVFRPYTHVQLEFIMRSRLEKFSSFFEDAAIMFCAKKGASVGGDIRKVLSIMRGAVDNCVLKSRQIPSDSGVKVTVDDVIAACKPLYGVRLWNKVGRSAGESMFVLPIHQWFVLVSLLHVWNAKGNKSSILLDTVFEEYCKVCESCRIEHLYMDEFTSTCQVLESYGFLKLHSTKFRSTLQVPSQLVGLT